MEKLDKTRLVIQGRSDGDGMEYTSYSENTFTKPQTSNKFHPSDFTYSKNFLSMPSKRKEPKFVPYEPYKAAVSPIIPTAKKCDGVSTHVVIDSQKVSSLASSIIQVNASKEPMFIESVINKGDAIKTNAPSEMVCSQDCRDKFRRMEEKMDRLEKEKKDLESQFQVQTEVNADLKKMLLASLGDDMQVKVQLMTEDKARLGMNVLQFSEEIMLKNEEIEKLSVQCDVWKSKFEASSVMVEELAQWKVTLSQKLSQAANAVDSILKEHKMIFDQLTSTYNILRSTQSAFNPNTQMVTKRDQNPKSLIQLAKENQALSLSIQERLIGRSCSLKNPLQGSKASTQYTPAEHAALQVLGDYDNLPYLVNSDSRGQLPHPRPGEKACQILPHICSRDPTVNCCKQCSGEITIV